MNFPWADMARHGLDLAEKDWRVAAVGAGAVVFIAAVGWLAKRWCDKDKK